MNSRLKSTPGAFRRYQFGVALFLSALLLALAFASPSVFAQTSPGTLQFGTLNNGTNSAGGVITLEVSRVGGTAGQVSVDCATSDGTAVGGVDYTTTTSTLAWADGDSADKSFTVPIIDRHIYDGSMKTFSIVLSAPTGGAVLGANTITVTISVGTSAPQPTVEITSPPDNITVVAGNPLTLSASVNDPGGILSQVQFFLNGNLYSKSFGKGPFTLVATPPAPGVYVLQAVVIDTQGGQNSSTRTVTVLAPDPANPAPASDFISPVDGHQVAGGSTLILTASADSLSADGSPLAKVDFYADNTLIASYDGMGNRLAGLATTAEGEARRAAVDPTGGGAAKNGTVFTAPWGIPNLSKLVNLLTVATTKSGLSQVSAPVTVNTVATSATSNHAPTVALKSVVSGQRVRVGAKITVPVTAADPDTTGPTTSAVERFRRSDATLPGGSIATMDYFLNKLKVASSTQPPYSFDFTPPAAGTYVLEAIGTDTAGLSGVADPVIVEATTGATVSLALPGAAGGTKATLPPGTSLKVRFVRVADDISQPLTVNYKLKGSAVGGVDYKTLSGTATIAAGSTSTSVKVRALSGGAGGGLKVLKLALSPVTDGSYDVGTVSQVKIRLPGQ